MTTIASLFKMLSFGRSSHADLINQLNYLTIENRILRSKLPKRITLTSRERQRMLRFGKPVGPAHRHIISAVQYTTFQGWIRGKKRKNKDAKKKIGRPSTKSDLKKLVVQMAKTPGWRYSRILGELRKLGIKSVSRITIRSILKEHGIEPAPDRAELVSDPFLKRHASTLWSCDFFTKKVLTPKGFKRKYDSCIYAYRE